MKISERFKTWRAAEAAKLRPLSFKEKLSYLLMYYKGWLALFILVAMAAGYLGDAVIQSHKETVLQGFFTNDEHNYFPAEEIEREYASRLGLGRNQRVVFDDDLFIDLNGEASEYTAASNGKLIAYMAVGELDFVVTSKEVLDHYSDQIPIRDLSELLPAELYASLSPQIVFGTDAAGKTIPIALDMSQSRYLNGADDEDSDSYFLFVPYNAPHAEQISDFITYCFSKNF